MEYVGYTNRHDLHQCITEHCSFNSTFGKHMQEKHRMLKSDSVFIVISLLDNDVRNLETWLHVSFNIIGFECQNKKMPGTVCNSLTISNKRGSPLVYYGFPH